MSMLARIPAMASCLLFSAMAVMNPQLARAEDHDHFSALEQIEDSRPDQVIFNSSALENTLNQKLSSSDAAQASKWLEDLRALPDSLDLFSAEVILDTSDTDSQSPSIVHSAGRIKRISFGNFENLADFKTQTDRILEILDGQADESFPDEQVDHSDLLSIEQWIGKLFMPVAGIMGRGFGKKFHPILKRWRMHTGVDIAARTGVSIRPGYSGRIVFAGWKGGYGNCVMVQHSSTHATLYAHMSRILVRKGQQSATNQTIGLVGTTGMSTGPHLHFELRVRGKPINPAPYIISRRPVLPALDRNRQETEIP